MKDPDSCIGVVCSGGTVANITALWTSRNSRLGPRPGFPGVAKAGFVAAMSAYGYSNAAIVCSSLAHYSFKKAVDILGLGEDGLISIPVDECFRVRGSYDDLCALGAMAKKYGIHFHVDAAWGGPVVFSTDHKSLVNGIEMADSITVDGHKQLYTPMGLGILLFKDEKSAQSIQKAANYIIRSGSFDSGKFTLEGSRPANILYLHAALSLLGREGYDAIITRSISLTRQFWNKLEMHPSRAFRTLHEPMSNILLYQYIPTSLRRKNCWSQEEEDYIETVNVRLQSKQSQEGRGFVSRTKVQMGGRVVCALRVVLANPLTEWDDIQRVVGEQLELGVAVEHECEQERINCMGGWHGWPFDL